jgi:ADP-ribose pyrophosphatase
MDKILHDGWIKVVERQTPDGRRREVVLQDPAVACIVENETEDKILLVKQFRAPADREVWEIPAGMMDVDGESAQVCMARELAEETGADVNPDHLHKLFGYYPNIGSSTAFITIFSTAIHEADLKPINDKDVVERKWFDIKEVAKMISEGEICDGKTIAAFWRMVPCMMGCNEEEIYY